MPFLLSLVLLPPRRALFAPGAINARLRRLNCAQKRGNCRLRRRRTQNGWRLRRRPPWNAVGDGACGINKGEFWMPAKFEVQFKLIEPVVGSRCGYLDVLFRGNAHFHSQRRAKSNGKKPRIQPCNCPASSRLARLRADTILVVDAVKHAQPKLGEGCV